MIFVFSGEGGGKTVAAFGMAVRALGQGKKVIVVQFLKGRKDVGEYKIAKRLGRNFKIFQFGRKEFVDFKKPKEIDLRLAKMGFMFAKQALKRDPFLLILDELNLAVKCKLLSEKEVVSFLKKIPKSVNLVITGRGATPRIKKIADGVSVIQKIKHPFDKGKKAKLGIEY
jgi:cob(I)alamin adenosyltransferase